MILIYGRDESAIEAAQAAHRSSRRHRADHASRRRSDAAARPPNFRWSRERSARPRAISARSSSPSTISPRPARPRAARCVFGPPRRRRDVALRHHARSLRRPAAVSRAAICATAICAPIPAIPPAMLRAVLKARDLVGSFDKPRYITFTAELCAHSRSKIVGCHRCLDLCPTGAITPAGDHVAIDAEICAGCGQCAAVCPTGAAAYALPPADALLRKLRTLLHGLSRGRRRAAVLLLHDERSRRRADRCAGASRRRPAGECAAARGQRGHAGRARSDRRGFCLWRDERCASCCAPKPRHDIAGLAQTIALAEPILAGLGFRRRARRDHRDRRSRCARRGAARDRTGSSRGAAGDASGRSAASATCCVSRCANCIAWRPAPVDVIALPAGRAVRRGRDQCRGLHAVPVLRVGLPDRRAVGRSRPARAALRRRCLRAMRAVQGDLPRKGHQPQAADSTSAPPPPRRACSRKKSRSLCIRCGKPFGVKSTIERVAAKLEGKHWMYPELAKPPRRHQDVRRLPRGRHDRAGVRSLTARRAAAPRTTDDYLRERDEQAH